MRFWQKYRYREDGHGEQTVWFAVSDSHSELQGEEGAETDIFTLESIKKDLNTDEGSFAVDELTLTIDHLSCSGESDENAMYFCLDAADTKVSRYVAVYFGEAPSFENLLFLGKISSKITGSDKLWSGAEWSPQVSPKRSYKFTAYSFDAALLEKATLEGDLYRSDGSRIDNVYDSLRADDWSAVKEIFDYKACYSIDNVDFPTVYNFPLGNLYKVVVKYLEEASRMLTDYTGSNVGFSLGECSLGVKTNPIKITLGNQTLPFAKLGIAEVEPMELKLSESDGDGFGWSSAFVHRKMIDPQLGLAGELNADEAARVSGEKPYSFKSAENVSALLYELVRCFACYLFAEYGQDGNVQLSIKSRSELVENDFTYIIGAEEAAYDTSSVLSKEDTAYYGSANNSATDGFDIFSTKFQSWQPVPSQSFEQSDKERKADERNKSTKYGRLLLTTSATGVRSESNEQWASPILATQRLNSPRWDDEPGIGSMPEYLHTALYIKRKVFEERDVQGLGVDADVWRPAMTIRASIDGASETFSTLTDYANRVMARDVQFYETEYNLTVPFWNAFSKNPDGSEQSWRNIGLGSKVKLVETVKRFIIDKWVSQDVERNYVVVGIERSLSKPETKLKLHNLERYAFGYWSGEPGDVPLVRDPAIDSMWLSGGYVQYFVCEESTPKGCAVMLSGSGGIVKSVASSASFGKTIGILIDDGLPGATVAVQTFGRVELDVYDFQNLSNSQVYVRTAPNTALNVSESPLTAKTADEDMVIILGKKESVNSFTIGMTELVWK